MNVTGPSRCGHSLRQPCATSIARRSLLVMATIVAMVCAPSLAMAQEDATKPAAEETTSTITQAPQAETPTDKPADRESPAKPVKSDEKKAVESESDSREKDDDNAVDKKPEDKKPEDKKPEDKKDGDKKETDKDSSAEKASEDKSSDPKKSDGDKPKDEKKKPEPPKKPEPRRLPGFGKVDGPILPGQRWRVHDLRRPHPPVVTPGELSTYERPGTPPSDAIVLFDGTDLSKWCHIKSDEPNTLLEAQWKVQDGYFEVTPGTGNLLTIDSFGSCQLHIEWQTPESARGDSQGRGNSGIFFMDAFEVQVLDSFNSRTYADGQAGAMYGQYPPMVNASRKPGEWQVYDIVFEAPKFSLDGKLEKPAKLTVMHNGVFLHHGREYYGPTGGGVVPQYRPFSPAGPIRLQNHGNPVRYRNVWLRPLPVMPE